jgi:hypothetical protein
LEVILPNGITKETFERADTDSKLNILYDQQLLIVNSIYELRNKDSNITVHCSDQWSECDRRFKLIEKIWYKLMGGVLLLAIIVPIITNLAMYLFI